jgi:hypothetical protein
MDLKQMDPSAMLFMAQMRPLRSIFGISYTSSNDETVMVPCVVNEDRYEVSKGYKITLECVLPGFGKHHFYQSDFLSLLKEGLITAYKKVEV